MAVTRWGVILWLWWRLGRGKPFQPDQCTMGLAPLKAALRNLGRYFLQSQFSQSIIFFRQHIWHPIIDHFYFHYIFGDKMTQSSNKRRRGTSWRARTEKKQRKDFSDQWNGHQRSKLKILEAQQVSQQVLCIYFKSKFHNEWGDWEKR